MYLQLRLQTPEWLNVITFMYQIYLFDLRSDAWKHSKRIRVNYNINCTCITVFMIQMLQSKIYMFDLDCVFNSMLDFMSIVLCHPYESQAQTKLGWLF